MNVYFIMMIITLLLASFIRKINLRNNVIRLKSKFSVYEWNPVLLLVTVIVGLPSFIISAIREGVGTDFYLTYVSIFDKVESGRSIRDVGYGLLNQFVLLFTNDYTWIFVLTSGIITYFSFKAIFQQSENKLFSCMLYFSTTFYFLSMNAVRQCISISIILFAIKYIKDKKLLKYSIAVLIASSFHSTALIVWPFYFLCQIDIKKKFVTVLLFISLPVAYFLNELILLLFQHIDFLKKYFGYYFNSAYATESIGLISLLVSLSLILLCIFINKEKTITNQNTKIIIYSQIIVFIFNILMVYVPLTQRLGWYFNYIAILYLPNLIGRVKSKKYRSILMVGIALSYFLYMFFTIFIKGYHEVLPYRSIFD